MTNLGGESVTGNLEYTFEGVTDSSTIISLQAGESFYWTVELNTAAGSHTAEFVAEWIPSIGYTDRDLTNNVASNTISVESGLVLNWAGSSLRILDADGNPANQPLQEGETYTFAINLTSQELGSLTIDCVDSTTNSLISTIPVNVSTIGQKVSLECQFIASAPSTTIQMVPSDPSVTNTYTRKLTTESSASNNVDDEQSGMGTGLDSTVAQSSWATKSRQYLMLRAKKVLPTSGVVVIYQQKGRGLQRRRRTGSVDAFNLLGKAWRT